MFFVSLSQYSFFYITQLDMFPYKYRYLYLCTSYVMYLWTPLQTLVILVWYKHCLYVSFTVLSCFSQNGKYLVLQYLICCCMMPYTTGFGVKTSSLGVLYIYIQIGGVKHLLHSRIVEKRHKAHNLRYKTLKVCILRSFNLYPIPCLTLYMSAEPIHYPLFLYQLITLIQMGMRLQLEFSSP